MSETTFPLIEVAGSSRDMGYQHGTQARPIILRYLEWIDELTGLPRDELCRRARVYLPLLETFSPRLVEEIRGLAEGARIEFEEALLCQARQEAERVTVDGCSAFALTGSATADGRPLAGQNQDMEPPYEEVGIILRVRPNDGRPRAIFFTFAGQLGFGGINEYGVSHFVNKLYGDPWQLGIPFYPLRRAFLELKSVGECLELAKKVRTCAAANFVLCDGQGDVMDIEVRPEKALAYAGDEADARLHTNHYLMPEFQPHETLKLPDSPERLERLRALIRERWGKITVDALKEILADHEGDPAGICRHGACDIFSIAGYIAEPAKGLFHVRRGYGCEGHWTAYAV